MNTEEETGYGLMAEARLIGGSCWLERSIFEMFGRWATTEEDPSIVVMFDDHAHRHAWHAEVLMDRMPELTQIRPQDLVTAPGEGVARAVEHAGTLHGTLPRLVAGYRVMCELLVVRHRELLDLVGTVGSPSTRRWVQRVIDDLVEEWAEGSERIRGLLRTTDDVESATAHQSRLELLLVDPRGSIPGP